MAIQPTPELIRAIQNYKQGRQQDFEVLYRSSLPYLTKCVLNVINRTTSGADETLLQDILQDTYLTIAEKLDTLQKEEAFYQWAGQIATNHALRTWKKAIQRQEQEQAEDDLLYELADEQFIPEDILADREKQQLIRNMLQELPTGQYLCLVEYFYNGLKEREIAEKLQMPLGTVKTNLSRAKKKLKDIVQTYEKKHDVKLYSMSWLLWLLLGEEIKALVINERTARATFDAVSSQLPAPAAAAVSAAGAASAHAAAGGATGAISAGVVSKIVAGVVAATLLVGGAAMAIRRGSRDVPQPSETVSIQTSTPATTHPVPETTLPVPETTQPVPEEIPQPHSGDIVLTPQDLAYMNQVASSFQLGAVPDGFVPYYKGSYMPAVNSYIAECAGAEGLLKAKIVDGGMEVTKADLEQFLMDTLGWIPDVDLAPYAWVPIIQSGETYLIEGNVGFEKKPLAIQNMWAVNSDTVEVVIDKEFYAFSCTFGRSAESPHGWILIAVSEAEDWKREDGEMCTGIYERGIVLPEDGSKALTDISFAGELTMEAATAYLRQYVLATTGVYPQWVESEDWGLAANAYYTYKISVKDSNGVAQQSYVIGTSDAAIFLYDEATTRMEKITWSLGDGE